ncbi:scoloptoxin SSD43-like [Tubulanus polymorphus]|uniref:scoloptoxin SSD43-like n=1 Tax=Tubulanus polymorphus TaxID=672921 RepID=UPI003DA2A329
MWKIICFAQLLICLGVHGQRNYFALSRGLTDKEKQHILDVHNMLRARTAKGQTKGTPAAADMVALEWDDRLMKQAQGRADMCFGLARAHDTARERQFNPYESVGQNFFGGATLDSGMFNLWFKELLTYSYHSEHCVPGKICGHYLQLIWGRTHIVGCGYNDCKGRYDLDRFYCNYAVGASSPWNGESKKPYTEGKPCTKCPAGYSFCMGDALCASKKACDNSDSKCECTLRSCENGGKLDTGNCVCNCPKEFEGPTCKVPCKDKRPIHECTGLKKMGYCDYSQTAAIFDTLPSCRKTCAFCGRVIAIDKGEVNASKFKTNVKREKMNLG